MERFTIAGIAKIYTPEPRFDGFYFKEVVGEVDPFVDGNFMPDCLRDLLEPDGSLMPDKNDEYISRELEWAQQQIGKTLECDELYFKAFATRGKVRITS